MSRQINGILRDWNFLLPVLLLGILAGSWLLRPGYFNMHDDLQMMRQLVMEQCFRDLQIPCRWTQHMGYGFGFPLFNYYPPLPYFVGQVIRLLGFSFVDTAKYTFFLSFVFSGITMYILARGFWGKMGGFLSSVFYIWAPYRAVDVFVRGAMNEAWSFVFFPLILWSSYKLIKEAQFRWIVLLTLSWFGLLVSHNLMVLIFTPMFAVWVLLWLWREKSWLTLPQLIVSGTWALGLAAFFTMPVILEQKFVHVETLVAGYYEYVAHFADLNQLLISRFWGYGASVWEEGDGMPFQIGHLHWILSLVVLGFIAVRYLRARKVDNVLLVSCYLFAAGWLAAFMAHSRSTPIWQAIPVLKFVQFPWRFNTLSTLSFSFLIGALPVLIAYDKRWDKAKLLVAGVLVASVLLLNKDYFKPEYVGPITDEEKFSGEAWRMQQTAGIFDYLPKAAKINPKDPQKVLAEVILGKGEISEMEQHSNSASFKVAVESEEAIVRIHIFQFPGWEVFVDGKETETFVGEDDWGRMNITVSKGEHEVLAEFVNTPVRTAGNLVSLFSWLALLTVPIWRRR